MLCLRRNAQNHNPPSKLTYKRHILRMSTIPRNDLDRLQLCRLTNMLLTSTQPKILLLGPTRVVRPTRVVPDQRPLNGHCCCCCWAVFFGVCKTPMQKFGNFSQVYTPTHQFSSDVPNTVKISAGWSVWKATLYWWQNKKHFLVPFGGDFPQFFLCQCAPWSHLYLRFHPNPFRFRGLITDVYDCLVFLTPRHLSV